MPILENLPFASYQIQNVCDILKGKHHLEINIKTGLFDKVKISKVVEMLNEISGKHQYLVLVNYEPGAKITLKGLKYLASSHAMKHAVAKAYILKTLHQRIMGYVFSFLLRTKIPIKLFTDKAEARWWLDNLIVNDEFLTND